MDLSNNDTTYMSYQRMVHDYLGIANSIQNNVRLALNIYDRVEQHTFNILNNERMYDLRRMIYDRES